MAKTGLRAGEAYPRGMGRGKKPQGRTARAGVTTLPFNPMVSFDEGEVVISLPELGLIGVGDDFDAAKHDLIEEVRIYAEQFRESPALQKATNRTSHAALLARLEAADAGGRLEELLFAAPEQSAAPVR